MIRGAGGAAGAIMLSSDVRGGGGDWDRILTPRLAPLQNTIKGAVERESMEWQTLRVDSEGRIEIL